MELDLCTIFPSKNWSYKCANGLKDFCWCMFSIIIESVIVGVLQNTKQNKKQQHIFGFQKNYQHFPKSEVQRVIYLKADILWSYWDKLLVLIINWNRSTDKRRTGWITATVRFIKALRRYGRNIRFRRNITWFWSSQSAFTYWVIQFRY